MTRRALVTGAAGQVGRAITAHLSSDGWHVVGLDVRDDGGSMLDRHVSCDLVDPVATLDAVAEIVGDGLDLLVNNAALQPAGGIRDGTVADWDAAFAVNVRAAFLTMQAASEALMHTKGAIVNIGSVHARATSPGRAAYVASKSALSGLTRTAALELAPLGIRVNAVLPGAVDTPMLSEGLTLSGTSLAALERRIPLGTVATPEDVANVVTWLASPQAAHLTGQEIVVDGGVTARLASE